MKILFAFYPEIPEWAALSREFTGLETVFAETISEIAEEITDADALFMLAPKYTADIAELVRTKAGKLKWIQATTVGVDEMLSNGTPPGVILTKAVGIFDINVAEQAMALLLSLTRQVAASDRDKQNCAYKREERTKGLISLERKNVGIIGYGGIGRQVGKRVKAFDTRLLVLDVREGVADSFVDEFYLPGQLEKFLSKCDVVFLTLPLTKENVYMFDRDTFKHMKRNCILINVSRGKLVKESALAEALREGVIAGAGLDVYEEEPLPETSELWELENVVMTPHLGGRGEYNRQRLAELFRKNIARNLQGEELIYVVDHRKGF